ncbi:EVE domain-containing protein [Facklamia miroungae]|uniref:EVE domain-containing protein n=1 Tax=Facklamia miroungae TaxID=120956 RepID=A0A1G7RY21_9LACT|nr:EVE domain-containing protein [Facklamia miroungae]
MVRKKSNEEAYVFFENNKIGGFLYLKDETEESNEIRPFFDKRRRLKVGTFKINAHGTVLGQRFLSIILRKMYEEGFNFTYVTLFKKQEGLIKLLQKFGFRLLGKKNNNELVYYKNDEVFDNIYIDFPRISNRNNNKFLLSILPIFHTDLFPDSKLSTEKNHYIEDLSFTNTIEKVYIAAMHEMANIKKGDRIVIYRTAEQGKSAEYSSVATSICSVIEVKNIDEFKDITEFSKFCGKGSIFSESELSNMWVNKKYPYVIKMLYNVPLRKRITRHDLIEVIGLNRQAYFGCLKISDHEFDKILEIGEVDEGFIID